jgi:hypothetical protein
MFFIIFLSRSIHLFHRGGAEGAEKALRFWPISALSQRPLRLRGEMVTVEGISLNSSIS